MLMQASLSSVLLDDEVPIPCLLVPSPQRPSAHAMAAWLAGGDDEVSILRITPSSPPVSYDSDDEILIPCPMLSCLPFSTPSLCLPSSLVAMSKAGWVWLISSCFFFKYVLKLATQNRLLTLELLLIKPAFT
jgi:hypothetical protein